MTVDELKNRITELEFQIRMNEMKYLERIEELENNLLIQNTHIEMLEYDIKSLAKRYKALSHAHKDLSDEEILQIKANLTGTNKGAKEAILKFARAIIKASRCEE